ncbi:uncharacterized protein LOC115454207 isoform X2 [Manduca sexta]|uniref:uncharacterized protein LOC115454207 isoform X2 n=1 Tax=Manduca sexta TaxID=7130 RepID=UPI00188E2E2D|nr:uncharacterized protein LOC115454207 isoform X2 [Manduca sexta]
MDDTQKSRTSDVNSSRKRRSSILKSQRPPRTPFSELEFNVATPTDTVKSRRVSFSRRTGVAEFVTNEATTTWKNFYEEHNKSLESSSNDSQVKAPRQPIGHIGKRIFDEQFEEVEAFDFIGQFNNPGLNINTSINNINLTQQLASLENTDNIKLSAPHTNFELSTFTENHSKLFGDELTAPTMGEMSERIDVNFSDIQSINRGKDDDLDEIERDLERAQNNVNYAGPFADRQNMSEYIEIDLNTTHITMGNEQSDMSITDTIHSQVQDVSKSCSIDKKMSQTKDWVTDKENIAINPYVTPRESVNFAINEEADKVLVFDGKRLTLQSERDDKKYRKPLVTNGPAKEIPQRKTIVLNVNDDLPNFIDDLHISNIDSFKGIVSNDCDKELIPMKNRSVINIDQEHISTTETAQSQNILDKKTNKNRTLMYEDDDCNISMTQALPANIIENKVEKSQTILYENDGNMSVTEAVPMNIVVLKNSNSDKRKTIVFEDDMASISMTQALPVNIIKENTQDRRTILYENDGIPKPDHKTQNIFPDDIKVNEKEKSVLYKIINDNVPFTNGNLIDNGKKCEENRTVIFGNDTLNISVTQAIPNNIIVSDKASLSERRKSIPYKNDMADLSITETIANNIVLQEKNCQFQSNEKIRCHNVLSDNISVENENLLQSRKTVYVNDTGDILISQAISSNTALLANEEQTQRRRTLVFEKDAGNISVTQAIPSNIILPGNDAQTQRRRTIVYENDAGNISVTQAIPSNIILPNNEAQTQRRRTIVYENDTGDISVTQAIPSNIILPDNEAQTQRRRTVVYENDAGDISVTQAIPSNIILPDNEAQTHRRRTIVYENDAGNISVTQAIPSNIILPDNEAQTHRRRTIVYENDAGNISVTQAIPSNIILPDYEAQTHRRRTIVYENDAGDISVTQAIPSNIILPDNEAQTHRRRTIVYGNDTGDISVTQAIPSNIILPDNEAQTQRRRTIVYENDTGDISVTQAIPNNIILPDNEAQTQRKRTIVYENNAGNISVTQAIPSNIILPDNEAQTQRRRTIVHENDTGDISVTQAIPSNIILPDNGAQIQGRRTVVYENDAGDISVTQAIPTNIILAENETHRQSRKAILNEKDSNNISVFEAMPSNIILRNEDDLPGDQLLIRNNILQNKPIDNTITNKRVSHAEGPEAVKTSEINIQNEEIATNSGNISITCNKDGKELFTREEDKADFEMATVAVDNTNLTQFEKKRDITEFREIEVHGISYNTSHNTMDAYDISAEQEVINKYSNAKNTNCAIILTKENYESHEIDTQKRKSDVVEDRVRNADFTKPIPNTLSSIQNDCIDEPLKEFKTSSASNHINRQVLLYQVTTKQTDLLESKTSDQSRCEKAIEDAIVISSPKIIAAANIIEEKNSLVIAKKNSELINHKKTIHGSDNTFNEHKFDIDKTLDFQKSLEQPKVALDNLLNMSNASMESETDHKNVMAEIVSEQQLLADNKKEDIDNISNESMFYITKDSDEEDQPDKETSLNVPPTSSLTQKEENTENDARLQKKLVEFKSIVNENNNSPPKNRHYEQIVSLGVERGSEKILYLQARY